MLLIVLYCELRDFNILKKLPTAKIVLRWRWKIPWYKASRRAFRSSTTSTWDVTEAWCGTERFRAGNLHKKMLNMLAFTCYLNFKPLQWMNYLAYMFLETRATWMTGHSHFQATLACPWTLFHYCCVLIQASGSSSPSSGCFEASLSRNYLVTCWKSSARLLTTWLLPNYYHSCRRLCLAVDSKWLLSLSHWPERDRQSESSLFDRSCLLPLLCAGKW